MGYIFSSDMAASFFEESKNVAPLVRHDDIYFGLLAAQLKMMPVSVLNTKFYRKYNFW